MSTTTKSLLGIFSFIPLVLFGAWIYFYVKWIMDFIPNAPAYEGNPDMVLHSIGSLLGTTFALLIPSGLLTLGLMIYYIIQIINSKTLPDTERIIWTIVIVLFNTIAFPIYWVMRIRTLPPKGAVPQTPSVPQGPTYG